MDMICNLDNVNDIIKQEGLDVLVISYGGSCCNALIDYLKKNNFKCDAEIWKNILCHCPQYIECDIPIIYIYDNPVKSFLSMKNRGNDIWGTNQQKMSNNKNVVLSDENLFELMIKQFNNWTNIKRDNVCVIKSCELFENNIVDKLETFLKQKIYHFPLPYINPKTNIESIRDNETIEFFKKYKFEIDRINNFVV